MEKKYENYSSLLNDTKAFNRNLSTDRKQRLPFIDSHTGIAQYSSNLWHTQEERTRAQQPRAGSILYSYPAQRWHKRRREYLLNPMTLLTNSARQANPDNADSSNQPQAIASTYYPYDQAYYPRLSAVETFHQNGNAIIPRVSGNPLAPSRADSTGSHSCVDSDSRDLSSATSQFVDSPKVPLDDEHSCADLDLHFTAAKSSQNDSLNDDCHVAIKMEKESLESCCLLDRSFDLAQVRHTDTNDPNEIAGELETQAKFKNRTREAIQMHSKMSRKKDAGQSLMKSNSLLVKFNSLDEFRTNNAACDQSGGIRNEFESDNQNDHTSSKNKSTNLSKTRNQNDEEPLAPEAIVDLSEDRPYICSICDQTYKTRPGLSYHFIHTHNKTLPRTLPTINGKHQTVNEKTNKTNASLNSSKKSKPRETKRRKVFETKSRGTRKSKRFAQENGSPIGVELQANEMADTSDASTILGEDGEMLRKDGNGHPDAISRNHDDGDHENPEKELNGNDCRGSDEQRGIIVSEPNMEGVEIRRDERTESSPQAGETRVATVRSKQNPFCDFCHGTADKNRRTRLPEEMISCSGCGSSGHLSCLRFSETTRKSVQKYNWQCIECKTCSTCDKADNEDQLLFCDDCDRSYHLYCLDPPLGELPEGNWSCRICQKEFHTEKEATKELKDQPD